MNLADILDRRFIVCNLNARSSEEAIRVLARKLYEEGFVKESFEEAVLKRESEMPTGLPIGEINAAIPHADIEHVLKPALAVATLASPLPFRIMVEPDNTIDVRIIFLLALNEPHAQIKMLQTIATALQDPLLLQELVKAHSAEDIYRILTQIKIEGDETERAGLKNSEKRKRR
jgi:PTS system galactitol-specific IIA component